MLGIFRSYLRALVVVMFIFSLLFSMYMPTTVRAANFTMQTGYYVGNGASNRSISGVGFQPALVLIKSSTTAGVAVFRSSAMPAANTAFLSATADNTATSIAFNANGFTLGTLANVNSANVIYTWTAFSGSDCSAGGNFCVGTFSGNGAATRTITTGFQPSMTIIKRSTAVGAHFRTASMAANRTEFFTSTAADTAGNYIRSFAASGFDVGATDNVSGGTYYYIAFKTSAGAFAEGTYTGDGTDNRNITGLGFQPDVVGVKNSASLTANNRRGVFSGEQHNGDAASFMGDAVADTTNIIQAMQSDGFQLGSGVNSNELGMAHYWFAFGGSPGRPAASGTFTAAQGTYTGSGSAFSVSSLAFAPDLILIKDNAANFAVFRTRQMAGDITAYLANASADFAGGVTALNANGFSIGTSAVTNTIGATYHWQAFGNAYNPDTNAGSADFAIGAYYGTGIDNKNIVALPYQPDLVAVKRNGASAGALRTSASVGDVTDSFSATAEAANVIQSLSSSGFQLGTSASANTAAGVYRWFAFKTSTNFSVGTFTGNAVNDRLVTTGFRPDLVWLKRSTAVAGVQRPETLAGNNTQYFANTANIADRIKSLAANGFTVGTQTEVNASGGIYRYASWRIPINGTLGIDIVDSGGSPVANPAFGFTTSPYLFDCGETTATLGSSSQKIRISNTTGGAAWSASIAATNGSTDVWQNSGNTQFMDYNEGAGAPVGCADGADADTQPGKLRVEPLSGTITPEPGCSASNVTMGTNQDYAEGVVDSITLVSAASGASTDCYWDITGIGLRQTIPAQQSAGDFTLNFTITATSL